MVFEKSFMMAKLCQAKGLLLDSQVDREDYFNRSHYFYGKCLSFGGNELKSEVEQQVFELKKMIEDLDKRIEPAAGGDCLG